LEQSTYDNPEVVQLVNKFPASYETQGVTAVLKEPAIGTYPQSVKSSTHTRTPHPKNPSLGYAHVYVQIFEVLIVPLMPSILFKFLTSSSHYCIPRLTPAMDTWRNEKCYKVSHSVIYFLSLSWVEILFELLAAT